MFFLVSASAIILPTAFGLKFERWEHDGLKLVIFVIFFSPPPPPPPPPTKTPKNPNFGKMEKNSGDIIILQMCKFFTFTH